MILRNMILCFFVFSILGIVLFADPGSGNSLDSSSKLQPRQDSSNQQRYDGDGFLLPQKK